MVKRIAFLLALAFGMTTSAALACPGDKAMMDGKPESSKPATPKTGT